MGKETNGRKPTNGSKRKGREDCKEKSGDNKDKQSMDKTAKAHRKKQTKNSPGVRGKAT